MAGTGAYQGLSGARSDFMSVRERGGVSEQETSAIGGSGRRGGPGEGPEMAPHHNICEEFMAKMGGEANTGTTGYGSGHGKTFGK